MRPLGVKDFSAAFRSAVVDCYMKASAGEVAKLFGLRSKQAVYSLAFRAGARKRHPISTVSVHKAVDNPTEKDANTGKITKPRNL